MAEIDLQMKEQNFMADHLFVTAANMTQAGCVLGAKILSGYSHPGYFSSLLGNGYKKDIARICNEGAKLLDINIKFTMK